MKALLVVVASLLPFSAYAQDPRIKSWKTVANENGYEFKYPNCWKVVTNNPDETNDPVTKARDIAVEETEGCARPLLDSPQPNGISFSAGWKKTPPRDELLKKIAKAETNAKSFLFFKRTKPTAGNGYVYADLHKDVGFTWIRWEMKLFCPNYEVFYSGPTIKNPDQSIMDRLKAGDIALPEPEKTIFESVRCTSK